MADIIPFPTHRITGPAVGSSEDIAPYQGPENFLGSLASGKSGKFEKMMEEIAELYEDSSLPECTYCRFSLRDDEDIETVESDFASLTELVVFSPEIQKEGFQRSETAESRTGAVLWGDVFLKSGDVYPFLFTVYTEDYVKSQLVSHGEKIVSSPKDIILRRRQLCPADIIQAVIKWVNVYSPQLCGKRVRLESAAVLQDLVCDPGIEVVVAEPS